MAGNENGYLSGKTVSYPVQDIEPSTVNGGFGSVRDFGLTGFEWLHSRAFFQNRSDRLRPNFCRSMISVAMAAPGARQTPPCGGPAHFPTKGRS